MTESASDPNAARLAPLGLLLVVDSLDGGGAERHVADLAVGLADRGHRVSVACSAGGELVGRLSRRGIAVERLGGPVVKRRFSLRYASWLRGVVRREAPDVVHAHIYASATAAAAAVADRVPLVVTDHTEGPWRGCGARLLSRLAYRRADGLIAVSTAIRDMLLDRYAVPPERISFVLPVPRERWPGAVGRRSSRGTGSAGPLVGRVARLQPEKGCDDFLCAAARVAAIVPAARFIVIGDGPQRAALAGLARRLGVQERVALLGYRPDARALIADLDLLVVSSRTDGSPLVVLEAMAAGVPVVATEVGGVPDQIEHGREGLLVPPGDPEALAAAVVAVLRSPAMAARMGTAGRRRAAALRHDLMLDAVERAYKAALARRGARDQVALPAPQGAALAPAAPHG